MKSPATMLNATVFGCGVLCLVFFILAQAASGESLRRSKHGNWTVYSDFQDAQSIPSCSMMQQRPAMMMGQFVFFDFDSVYMNVSRPMFAFAPGSRVHGRLNLAGGNPVALQGFAEGLNTSFALSPETLEAINQTLRSRPDFSVTINDSITDISGDGWAVALAAVKNCLSDGFHYLGRGGVRPGSLVYELAPVEGKLPYKLWAYKDQQTTEPLGCSVSWKTDDGALFEVFFPDIDGNPSKILVQHKSWRFLDAKTASVSYELDGKKQSVDARARWDAVIIDLPAETRNKVRLAMLDKKPLTVTNGDQSVTLRAEDGYDAAGALLACQTQIGGE